MRLLRRLRCLFDGLLRSEVDLGADLLDGDIDLGLDGEGLVNLADEGTGERGVEIGLKVPEDLAHGADVLEEQGDGVLEAVDDGLDLEGLAEELLAAGDGLLRALELLLEGGRVDPGQPQRGRVEVPLQALAEAAHERLPAPLLRAPVDQLLRRVRRTAGLAPQPALRTHAPRLDLLDLDQGGGVGLGVVWGVHWVQAGGGRGQRARVYRNTAATTTQRSNYISGLQYYVAIAPGPLPRPRRRPLPRRPPRPGRPRAVGAARDHLPAGAQPAAAVPGGAVRVQPTGAAREEPGGRRVGLEYGTGYRSAGQTSLRTLVLLPSPHAAIVDLSCLSVGSIALRLLTGCQSKLPPAAVPVPIPLPAPAPLVWRRFERTDYGQDYIQIMLNRLRQNAPAGEGQWRASQQLPSKPKSPLKLHENYNPYSHRGQENDLAARNTHAQALKAKPLISPRRTVPGPCPPTHRAGERSCVHHPGKRAEFMAEEGEEGRGEFFCGRCAAQLATRGCEVVRLEAAGLRVSKRNELPHYPQYEHEPIYQEIMEILRLCNSGIAQHAANIDRFAALEQEYQQQIDLTAAFYDRLAEIIEEMKGDHLFDLAQERDKYTQIADIENDHLRENIIEINVIKNDIENHLEEVLDGIRETGNTAECRESLDHYRQKLTLFGHQLEEQLESLTGVTRYPQHKIDAMLLDFEDFLKVLWDAPEAQHPPPPPPPQLAPPLQAMNANANMNSALTVKNIHQILPRGVNEQEGRRAFRNLEEEEEEPFQERRSPNFKKI